MPFHAHVHGTELRGRQFIGFKNFDSFEREESENTLALRSPLLRPTVQWTELVPSWNVEMPPGSEMRLEARAIYSGHATRFYTLGIWSNRPETFPGESVRDQKDEDGDVQTDTWVATRPGGEIELRITLSRSQAGDFPRLRFIGLALCDSRIVPDRLPPNRAAWGKVLSVPERSQMAYEGGRVWCSPASLSMVLEFWANARQRSDLNHDVPEIARAVHDRHWPGTGNWPFNTAFAGSFPGMRAYVARLSDLSELEDWIAAGIPVIASVSYGELKGARTGPDGHLVVCVGFTECGDVIVNDPGTLEGVQKTFPRENMIRAWAYSKNTVYLIQPEEAATPLDRFGHWHDVRPLPEPGKKAN